MALSADFHDSASASELGKILRTGKYVTDLIETSCFKIAPNFIDLFVALFYLYFSFGSYMMLTAFGTIIFYFYFMAVMTTRRRHLRGDYIMSVRNEEVLQMEGISGWETASVSKPSISSSAES